MNAKLKAVAGVTIAVIGVLMMAVSGSRVFADGVRADASGSVGAIGPVDVALGAGGVVALIAGVVVLGYAVIALRSRPSARPESAEHGE